MENTPLCPIFSVLCSRVCERGGAAPAAGGGAEKAEGAGCLGYPLLGHLGPHSWLDLKPGEWGREAKQLTVA